MGYIANMAKPEDDEPAGTSLRQWLDRPDRPVDRYECLHIFQQIVEAVDLAHAQGVAVGNVRPSCLVVSELNRVVFIESDSCSSSGTGSFDVDTDVGGSGSGSGSSSRSSRVRFPLKQILMLEDEWYTSPEGGEFSSSCRFASDIYQLGVLLFELICTFDSIDEKLRTMSNLRHRVLPPHMLLKWPKEASFCLWLLHPQPESRPKMSEVLRSEFLSEPRNNLEEHKAAINLTAEIEEQELLLEFLLRLQKYKQEVAEKLHDTVCFVSTDIEEVGNQPAILLKKGSTYSELDTAEHSRVESFNQTLTCPAIEEEPSCSDSKRHLQSGHQEYSEVQDGILSEIPISGTRSEIRENVLMKSSRLMKNFKKFEAAYLSTRCRLTKPAGKVTSQRSPIAGTGSGLISRTEVSTVDSITSKERHGGRRENEWVNPFLEGLCKYLSFCKLKVRADLKQGDLLNTSNLVCSLGFDRDREFFASAGANRKIKIFECDMILNEDRDIHYPVVEMKSRSKISSISWNSYIKSQIASSDFDGVVQVWDVSRSQVSVEMREHQRRVWSVDFSPADPMKLASGSDDCSVKLWYINQAASIGTIRTKANVCSVQFPPDSAWSLAIGSADHRVYCYDLRNLNVPFCTLIGHAKTVSYVKYLDSSTIVSASTDNSVKLWDLSTSTSRVLHSPLLTFTGHTNVKNFVGLTICDGYIATGSETNEVFVYHKAFPMPVLSYKFDSVDPVFGEVDDAAQFISSVCWRGQSTTLLAANSAGNIKILEMV